LIHRFPEDFILDEPCGLDNPFRYAPHPSVKEAAGLVMQRLDEDAALASDFAEGKMLGVLVVKDASDSFGYLAAFSGNVGGRSMIEGFVPPIYDLTDPDGEFKRRESEITEINRALSSMTSSEEILGLKAELTDAERDRDYETDVMRKRISESRKRREEIRHTCSDPSVLEELIKESQFEKAELKRLKIQWESRICDIRDRIVRITGEIEELKSKRASMSEELQNWIFRQYIVHNSSGEESSILDIFAAAGTTPPGGTGECAAPKLLEYAYRNGLQPLAMGEFWYGRSPSTAVRTHGHFYPSCTSKCGPLLGFMLRAVEFRSDTICGQPAIIYEDEHILAVAKPSGMPSVPGLDGRTSLLEFICSTIGPAEPVHRLDMDTSGVMLFARTDAAASSLRAQFQEHTVKKTYHARLSAAREGTDLHIADTGTVRIPLSPDFDERPRQKADTAQGKESLTAYEVSDILPDGSIEIVFHPHTGRTHQLRVHSAHICGLGHPIAGDMLYGGSNAERLCLHAYSICFKHPYTGHETVISSEINHYR
jgi:tRNA pseudouridine32 synthase/23S rRNA pseudouridine746 synthase